MSPRCPRLTLRPQTGPLPSLRADVGLAGAQRVDMVEDYRPAIGDDKDRDRVRAHRAVGELGVLCEVRRRQLLELLPVDWSIRNARAAVRSRFRTRTLPCSVINDAADLVAAVGPALLEDLAVLELQVAPEFLAPFVAVVRQEKEPECPAAKTRHSGSSIVAVGHLLEACYQIAAAIGRACDAPDVCVGLATASQQRDTDPSLDYFSYGSPFMASRAFLATLVTAVRASMSTLAKLALLGVSIMRGGYGADERLAQVACDVDLDHVVLLHGSDRVVGDAGAAVQHERAGAHCGDRGQMVEVDPGRVLDVVHVTDGNGEQITARAPDELSDLVGVGLAVGLRHVVVLLAGDGAQLRLYGHAVGVAEVHRLAREADVLLERQGSSVDHDGSEAGVHVLAYVVKRLAMVQVQCHGHGVAIDGALSGIGDVLVVGDLIFVGANALGCAQMARASL